MEEKIMDDIKDLNFDKGTDGKTKGMRLSTTTRLMYEAMKAAAGGTDDTFIDHLLQISKLYDLQKTSPEFAEELKELQKYMSRLSSVYIRMREKGLDAVEEVKEKLLEEEVRMSQEMESLRMDLTVLQKKFSQKEEELTEAYSTNNDLHTKLIQFEKTSQALEEIRHLTGEKVAQLEKRVEDLNQAETDAAEMKLQLQEAQRIKNEELAKHKEVERVLRLQLEEQQKENDRRIKDTEAAAEQKEKEHVRALEVLKKETEMEAKEAFLKEKSLWQENMSKMMNQLSEQHANNMAEILEKIQGSQRDRK
ncbi:histone-lysine N-methyltransferase, H3 lysine-79 [Paenibacillus periandrae]|uniref:histone-lysine N-methyltransferase, H3 lysine-79 n=1 Tax=Paenibacillus periandrae TaxID=1761741 RepID=UPI001F08F2D0|nr:histone-lysine N-methyltransferase, H3 lysine-79 [Paenibacillus periandrae]